MVIGTRDWKDRNTKVIVERVMKQVKDGDIILMHDLYDTSAQAAIIFNSKTAGEGISTCYGQRIIYVSSG